MTPLAKNLFERRYDDLVALGRSRLPGLAPEWTDYNAHDPGITLMELLGFVAEAQLHALSRMRRDERAAYAALMGVQPRGTRPASGLLWPDERDSRSPSSTWTQSVAIDTDAAVRVVGEEKVVFHPSTRVLWVPARITRIAVRHRNGAEEDLTTLNGRGVAFSPFGADAGPGDVLAIAFEVRGEHGLFPKDRQAAKGAHFVLGIRAAGSGPAPEVQDEEGGCAPCESSLDVALVADGARYPLSLAEDTSAGLLRTGALMLDVSGVKGSPKSFSLEIRAPRGFVRPPRWLRVTPSVLPIVQREPVSREPHEVNAAIDFSFRLDNAGLCRVPGASSPISLDFKNDKDGVRAWQRCERLEESGPEDAAYELDEASGRVCFGNGVNGRAPHAGSPVFVSYAVSDGAAGNVARNRQWRVPPFAGTFGVNPDPISGGAGRTDEVARRRDARQLAGTAHALVTQGDLVDAAMRLPLLGVARAWTVRSRARPGIVTLVVLREREGGKQPRVTEPRRWLAAIRRALAPRVPLGSRLAVVAPRYVDFAVRASFDSERERDPRAVQESIMDALQKRLALVATGSGAKVRAPGIPVAAQEVGAWIRSVEGVTGVSGVRLVDARGFERGEISVPADALPRLDVARSAITPRGQETP